MTSPANGRSEWEQLTPWEKAMEWHATAPEIASKIMYLAERGFEDAKAERRRLAEHQERMDLLLWWATIIAQILGAVNVSLVSMVAWRFAEKVSLTAGISVFTAGVALAAGTYAGSQAIANRVRGTRPPETTDQPAGQPGGHSVAIPGATP